ncbi:uncharacterized protein PAC_08587 [Phialocephala subalpina]|uniref:Uncharacterized protein n=1 Tax=Phialocephala subalpina TaxID=576137 RepID=A0A1L7X0Z9_9HELO|nr:uncharacterized protein PAC_08587 [Phialocephala subalpina]
MSTMDEEFVSTSPPSIEPNTRIMDVCRTAGVGMLATCLLQSLIATTEAATDFNAFRTDKENRITVISDEDILENPVCLKLAEALHEASRDMDNLREQHRDKQYNLAKEKAIRYMASYPGPHSAGGPALHVQISELIIGGRQFEEGQLSYLDTVLATRLQMMQQATDFLQFMDIGIQFPPAHEFDQDKWFKTVLSDKRSQNLLVATTAREKRGIYDKIFSLVYEHQFFRLASRWQGPGNQKPKQNIVIALPEANLSEREVEQKLIALRRMISIC